ncbi:MAG TPA: phospholipid carrier-dependent glycosyltransferase [Candidatus Dormibacteraeota bacterium]|nr:phospholipid carrier-dependent glycosyltransferase [Candidatus Dormibacteraeota bacterium]
MASKNADVSVRVTEGAGLREALPLLGILAVGLAIRLIFLPALGYKNDVESFESWALTLYDHGVRGFYQSTSFIDYPPGYLWVLGAVAWVYHALHVSDASAGYYVLRDLVKLPAILADLACSVLVYALARRFVGRGASLGAAALFALNPATIYVSAFWGQVDSVSAALTLGALLAMLRKRPLWAWSLLATAVLVKPQALVLAPLFVAYEALHREERSWLRLAVGPVLAVAVGYAIAAPFAPHPWNPVGTLTWLIERYAHGTSVYPYSSINAFNIYAVARRFWQPDSQIVAFLPQSVWGIVLVLASATMIVWRFVQRRDDRSFVEAAFLVSLALFLFATRMHERYVYNAFAIAIVMAPLTRRHLAGALLLTVTFFANLVYSYDYLRVVDARTPGVDPTNLMPLVSHPASLLNVVLFAYLMYVFLGVEERGAAVAETGGGTGSSMQGIETNTGWSLEAMRARMRSWFSPLEGTAALTRLDWAIAGGLTLGFFILVMIDIAHPRTQIFDEIYYARTAGEYLRHKDVFEWTHPPLTKLLMALGVLLNGGYPKGFTSFGWRLASAVTGSLTVPLLYAFAKRLLRSTAFAVVTAGLLVLSGFQYVQARIATPEITVAFFSLASLYCAYRYLIASQVRVVPRLARGWPLGLAAGVAAAAAIGAIAAWLLGFTPFIYHDGRPDDTAARIGAFVFFGALAYLIARLALPRFFRREGHVAFFADGSVAEVGPGGIHLSPAADNGGNKKTPAYRRPGLEASFAADGSERYRTVDGEALFGADGTLAIEPGAIRMQARDATLWMWLLALALACVVDSKWNGFFTLFWVMLALAIVVSQRVWCRPAQWGNPRIPLDVIYAAFVVVGVSVYVLSYIPYFTLGHNLADLMGLQRQMFLYHDELKATHPYQARWWEWPIIWRPISYYYHDFGGPRHLVAEILALPNPVNWWFGLLSVPAMFVIGLVRRHKGFALLIGAYLWQWLPWIISPRITFEYHFFPNLAVICVANALVLQETWRRWGRWGRIAVIAFLAAVAWAFLFWFPIWIGAQIPYTEWQKRMLEWLMGTRWI